MNSAPRQESKIFLILSFNASKIILVAMHVHVYAYA